MTYSEQHSNNKATETATKREGPSKKNTSSTSTIANTHPGVFLEPFEWEQIRQGYEMLLGALNAYRARDIEIAVENHLEVSAILDALEQTALAPRPSHSYLRAILMRYTREGIYTADRAEAQREERRLERYNAKKLQYNTWYGQSVFDPPVDWF